MEDSLVIEIKIEKNGKVYSKKHTIIGAELSDTLLTELFMESSEKVLESYLGDK